ncbi:cation-translocating P-type ATPase [Amycolatopsis cihanbeyliensis]|uniref:Cation-transporting ATPase F n=1 Tax=Amycolatopsis cihanbeyliensis TaxID=1128664 RepID=A0A542DE35_AMYCI|nr:HAD-IC family P-type ATPase [Amycolatopsis cihanbeyliensis]TQJ01320.1 cation-transporting ATPase F [Amycolatopsis cihanbeyliensis]
MTTETRVAVTGGTDPLRSRAHRLTVAEVAEELHTDSASGLTTEAAGRHLAAHGPNTLPTESDGGALRRLLRQFHDPLVYVLLAAVAVTLALGQLVDAGVILGVVLLNAVIGYVQEARARQAIDALARMAASEATVVRDGATRRVAAAGLVPGDLLVLQAGDKVPADVRLVRATSLEIDESAVTGESVPAGKSAAALPSHAVLADRTNLAHSGTIVTRGSGMALVTGTGADTELGLISRLTRGAGSTGTPLTRKLAGFSRKLAVVIVVLAALTMLVGLLRGDPFGDTFVAAVALAVGAIPEGLPAAVTIVLAIGVTRMSRRHTIVRRLPAVETLGGTTVICTDKTGTLTANEMTVTAVLTAENTYPVTGSGYAPEGELAGDLRRDHALAECLLAGVHCNEATLRVTDDGWQIVGDPTEGALLVVAAKAGLERPADQRVDTLPFESERQLMATLHRDWAGRLTGYVKGAPERVLALCADQLDAAGTRVELDREAVRAIATEHAGRGLRVLAFARFTPPRGTEVLREEDLPGRLTFLGLQLMHDPPRPEAMDAVAACRRAGVEIKMITGDHGATAEAIGHAFGLPRRTVSGAAIATTPDDELADTTVFARVSPEQKLRLVRLLQRRGQVVAMTGDGVNDAPALRQADIGIAMGKAGTEAAKEAADMVLTDDNFASIEAAVEEGRGVFDNLRKFLAWTLPTNIAEGLVILVAILVGATLPILPVQILWINMTTAVFLGLTLAFQPKEPGIMDRPPRSPGQALLTGDLVRRILLVSLVLVSGAFAVFQAQLASGVPVAEARTAAINVFVLVEVMYLISCRSLDRLRARGRNPWLLGGIALMLGLQALITYVPILNTLFHTAPVGAEAWLLALGIGLVAYAVVESDKVLWRRFDRRGQRGRNGQTRSEMP